MCNIRNSKDFQSFSGSFDYIQSRLLPHTGAKNAAQYWGVGYHFGSQAFGHRNRDWSAVGTCKLLAKAARYRELQINGSSFTGSHKQHLETKNLVISNGISPMSWTVCMLQDASGLPGRWMPNSPSSTPPASQCHRLSWGGRTVKTM